MPKASAVTKNTKPVAAKKATKSPSRSKSTKPASNIKKSITKKVVNKTVKAATPKKTATPKKAVKKTTKPTASASKKVGGVSNLTSAAKVKQNKKANNSKAKTNNKKTALLGKVAIIKASQDALNINELTNVKSAPAKKGKYLQTFYLRLPIDQRPCD